MTDPHPRGRGSSALLHAPEIDRPGLEWFNTPQPLPLAALRGKLVILDFWTSCCINCLHVLPSLRRIEESFPDEVAVIGVHSPKFAAERESENLRHAIARYDIRHPVISDPGMTLWRQYGVRAWPSLVFLSPEGRIIGHAAGEPDPERLFAAVAQTLEDSRSEGTLAPAGLELAPPSAPAGRLAFPGKIKPVPGDKRCWALADAGHHQIVLLDDDGRERARFGAGEAGFTDGRGDEARFRSPQGLAATAETLFVADTGNHALRAIDLASGRVETLAGTGRRGPALGAAREAREAALASPWDIEVAGERLLFANAGSHQLGAYDRARGRVVALAGTAGEDIADGPAAGALLAQPSGLALDAAGRRLAFADSETSSIRLLLVDEARIETLVGCGLFDFGHVNGALDTARLQHALGVAWLGDERLLVADSYNHALRAIDLKTRTVADFAADFTCADPLCRPLAEPAGIWADGLERVLVSDTNNHRVLEYNLERKSYRSWSE